MLSFSNYINTIEQPTLPKMTTHTQVRVWRDDGNYGSNQEQQLNLQPSQLQLQLQAMETNNWLIEENNRLTRNVAEELQAIQEAWHEVGKLVAEQGAQVSSVATLATQAAEEASKAHEELQRRDAVQCGVQ